MFGQASAAEVSQRWLELQPELKIRFEKVSLVPDHVHLAVTLHPAASPAVVVTALLNAAQEVMWRQLDRDVIQAGVERLWPPSAYIGSFGDLTSAAISAYVARWEREDAEEPAMRSHTPTGRAGGFEWVARSRGDSEKPNDPPDKPAGFGEVKS